jgi:hypothetical protein
VTSLTAQPGRHSRVGALACAGAVLRGAAIALGVGAVVAWQAFRRGVRWTAGARSNLERLGRALVLAGCLVMLVGLGTGVAASLGSAGGAASAGRPAATFIPPPTAPVTSTPPVGAAAQSP